MKVTRRPMTGTSNRNNNWTENKTSSVTIVPSAEGDVTPLKGFSVQRGKVVASAIITSDDPDISILRPDHDVILHINPQAPDTGVSVLRRPDQNPPQEDPPRRRKGSRNTMRESMSMGGLGGLSHILRRWEHMDNQGTLSRGLVRSDGSFAFTNCRPPEGCIGEDSNGS